MKYPLIATGIWAVVVSALFYLGHQGLGMHEGPALLAFAVVSSTAGLASLAIAGVCAVASMVIRPHWFSILLLEIAGVAAMFGAQLAFADGSGERFMVLGFASAFSFIIAHTAADLRVWVAKQHDKEFDAARFMPRAWTGLIVPQIGVCLGLWALASNWERTEGRAAVSATIIFLVSIAASAALVWFLDRRSGQRQTVQA